MKTNDTREKETNYSKKKNVVKFQNLISVLLRKGRVFNAVKDENQNGNKVSNAKDCVQHNNCVNLIISPK